jgi:hypothetical protein
MSRTGVISGYPLAVGTRTVTVRVRDARRTLRTRRLPLRVPTALPAGCIARSCAKLSKDGHTVAVPAADITSVTRDAASGKVTQVGLDGIGVATGDVLVLAPATGIPSGLIAVVDSVTGTASSSTAAVTTATPADAYHLGVVQALGRPAPAAGARIPKARPSPRGSLKCNGSVTSDLHGLTVTPSLTPTVAAYWKHPLFGGKGFYLGLGGLKLFQFSLTGAITVNLGVSVSGKATCALKLPSISRLVPAGDLGAVLLQLHPELTLTTTGRVDVQTSATLSCTVEYRWDQGKSYRADFCTATHQPLGLTSASGVDATLTGAIDASASLDDLPGVTGSIDASLHVGYRPARRPPAPVAEIDAQAGYDLKATLANFWKGAPSLTIAHGTIFDRTLATYGTAPPGAAGPPGITVTPALAWPWSDAVCGFDDPAVNTFTVDGTGFQPGEAITISTGWADYGTTGSADLDGSFGVTEPVGEVPSVLYADFGVDASGGSGSQASGSIELDSDGCVYQTDDDGTISLQWGGNGEDPYSAVSLSIDGSPQDSGTTDAFGSGGSDTSFACPSSGSYTWDVYGYINGESVYAEGNMDCAPSGDASRFGRTGQQATTSSPVSAGRLPGH